MRLGPRHQRAPWAKGGNKPIGQTLCLLLTLLVVPVSYSWMAEMKRPAWAAGLTAGWGRMREAVARRFGRFS